MHALLSMDMFRQKLGFNWVMSQIIMIRSLNALDTLVCMYARMICGDSRMVVPLTAASFADGSCLVVHRHDSVIVWVSAAVSEKWLQLQLGVPSFHRIQREAEVVGELRGIVREWWGISGRYCPSR
jgi:hypothetical protein